MCGLSSSVELHRAPVYATGCTEEADEDKKSKKEQMVLANPPVRRRSDSSWELGCIDSRIMSLSARRSITEAVPHQGSEVQAHL